MELKWCAGLARMRRGTQGHVAEPREPTRLKVGRKRGRGHGSPCGCPGGTTWREGGLQVEGPRVSRPWLVIWVGNANALHRPSFYTRLFLPFSPCGTMFSRNFFFSAGRVAVRDVSDVIAMHPSRGRGVHRIVYQTRAQNKHLSEV